SQILEVIPRFRWQGACAAELRVVSGNERAESSLKIRDDDGIRRTREEIPTITVEISCAYFGARLTTLSDDGREPGEQVDTVGDRLIVVIILSLDRVDGANPKNSREQTERAQGQGAL